MLAQGYISCLPKILLFTYHFCSKSADNRGLFTKQKHPLKGTKGKPYVFQVCILRKIDRNDSVLLEAKCKCVREIKALRLSVPICSRNK